MVKVIDVPSLNELHQACLDMRPLVRTFADAVGADDTDLETLRNVERIATSAVVRYERALTVAEGDAANHSNRVTAEAVRAQAQSAKNDYAIDLILYQRSKMKMKGIMQNGNSPSARKGTFSEVEIEETRATPTGSWSTGIDQQEEENDGYGRSPLREMYKVSNSIDRTEVESPIDQIRRIECDMVEKSVDSNTDGPCEPSVEETSKPPLRVECGDKSRRKATDGAVACVEVPLMADRTTETLFNVEHTASVAEKVMFFEDVTSSARILTPSKMSRCPTDIEPAKLERSALSRYTFVVLLVTAACALLAVFIDVMLSASAHQSHTMTNRRTVTDVQEPNVPFPWSIVSGLFRLKNIPSRIDELQTDGFDVDTNRKLSSHEDSESSHKAKPEL